MGHKVLCVKNTVLMFPHRARSSHAPICVLPTPAGNASSNRPQASVPVRRSRQKHSRVKTYIYIYIYKSETQSIQKVKKPSGDLTEAPGGNHAEPRAGEGLCVDRCFCFFTGSAEAALALRHRASYAAPVSHDVRGPLCTDLRKHMLSSVVTHRRRGSDARGAQKSGGSSEASVRA